MKKKIKLRKNRTFSLVLVGSFLVVCIGLFFLYTPRLTTSHFMTWIPWNCKFVFHVSPENGAKIEEIVTTVAESDPFSLAFKRNHLTKMADILHKEVPSLQFWAYIFSNPKLANDMKTIQKSSLKYKEFVVGARDQVLREYYENHCFLKEARGFANFLQINPDTTVEILKQCLEEAKTNPKGFKPILDYLIAEKSN